MLLKNKVGNGNRKGDSDCVKSVMSASDGQFTDFEGGKIAISKIHRLRPGARNDVSDRSGIAALALSSLMVKSLLYSTSSG